ncbi:hypothetical protein LCGC14_2158580 [marine sediment metagenome]|uniref:Large ribosomal subunit protein uL5 C-terminal domain-containing protein n=1 Tax=marine sediment metagenome TaxID=412755 RepID=A0A0F9EFN1_9ZZZZ
MTFKTRTAAATAAVSIMLGSGAAMAQQSGLVNVSVDDNTVQVPVSVAANVCDVDVNVLSDLVGSDESACTIDQETAANSNSPMLQSAAKAAGKTDKINDKLDDRTEKLEDRAEKLTDKADKRADKAADKIEKARGMDIIVTTTAKTDDEARELLRLFGFPFIGHTAEQKEAA